MWMAQKNGKTYHYILLTLRPGKVSIRSLVKLNSRLNLARGLKILLSCLIKSELLKQYLVTAEQLCGLHWA